MNSSNAVVADIFVHFAPKSQKVIFVRVLYLTQKIFVSILQSVSDCECYEAKIIIKKLQIGVDVNLYLQPCILHFRSLF